MTGAGPSKDRNPERIAELEAELERLQSSARFQLGDLLISLRSPASWLQAPWRATRITRSLVARSGSRRLAIALEWGAGDRTFPDIAALPPAERRALARICAGRAASALPSSSSLEDLAALVSELRGYAENPAALFAQGAAHTPQPRPSNSRVLFVVRSALPAVRNGYALRTHALARALTQAGWSVCVAMLDQADGTQTDIDGVMYRGAGTHATGLGPEAWISPRVEKVSRIAASFEPDIIHAASNFLCAAVASRAAAARETAWTYEVRGLWHITRSSVEPRFPGGPGFAFQNNAEREAIRQAKCVFTNGPALENWAREAGAQHTVSIPNGASDRPKPDDAAVQTLRLNWGAKPDMPVIGYLGKLTSYEGLPILMEASAMLTRRGIQHRLVIAGDGPELGSLRQAGGARPDVVFTGLLDDGDAWTAAHAFNIHAVPRLDRPVTRLVPPLKPLDAMAAGRALVVSGLPSMADIIAAGAGIGCKAGDTKSLAAALARLIADEALRASTGEAGQRLVREQRSWTQAASKLAENWRGIAAAP